MIDTNQLTVRSLGGMAKDVLGQLAPQCLVNSWVIDFIQPDLRGALG